MTKGNAEQDNGALNPGPEQLYETSSEKVQCTSPSFDQESFKLLYIQVRDNCDESIGLQVTYDEKNSLDDMERTVLSKLNKPKGTRILFHTAPVLLTPDNWKIHNKPNALWVAKVNSSNSLSFLDPQTVDTEVLPEVRNASDLFKQEATTKVAFIQAGSQVRTGTVMRKVPRSFKSLTVRIPTLFELVGERWHYADGSEVSFGNFCRQPKILAIDIGYAFRCKPSDAILAFCVVQTTIFETVKSSAQIGHCTPAYRVRKFGDADEAKEHIVRDATDYGFGIIGSYVVLESGATVDGLFCEDYNGNPEKRYGM
ncbi:MAG: hypothetical protein Q9157_003999 [Trypethelium eluteriae]